MTYRDEYFLCILDIVARTQGTEETSQDLSAIITLDSSGRAVENIDPCEKLC
jgi:hypothetical protein